MHGHLVSPPFVPHSAVTLALDSTSPPSCRPSRSAPEPPADLLFSDVTHSSLSVSWTKPRNPVDLFKVTYANTENGKPVTVTADSQHSSLLLSQLSPGSSYEVRVFSMKGLDESDPITGLVVTVPDPPTSLRIINITNTKAVLHWSPALAKVDRYIVIYGSENVRNLTVTVPGNAAVLQMKDLQSATVYHVTVTSQLDSLQSIAASATFTTAGESGWRWEHHLITSQVTPRSAVLSWRPPSAKVTGYKLSYQMAGEEMKEMILDSTVTQHRLTGLLPMSKYTAKIQAARMGRYSAPISVEFNTDPLHFPFPTDCSQELLNGLRPSGEVLIYPSGRQGAAVRVYCDMESDGGGWTVFQRRMNGRTDFFRSWNDYSKGFGNLSEEFWLGNEPIHSLTSLEPMVLRVDLAAGAESAFAHYSSFSIDSQRKFYTVNLSGYSGTAGDSMQYHNGRPFSTKDRDPKPVLSGCATSHRGGWWYKDCHEANLNGLYDINTNHQGVIWMAWKGRDFSIPFTEMKIRPQSFIPQSQE
ncbi:tenascin-like isoform X2 [Brienomyrus brachyistius]|uniref:tenascin-like isoform X2 n=1 Tax=Brienomyrus brachyistius TaxID=42636 RepID=UPI0020B43349|nr:tenascin-like isoform X2 [Brienomyrus brachyistius]